MSIPSLYNSNSEFIGELESEETKFSNQAGLVSNCLKKLADTIEAADWLKANSSILSRVSQSMEAALEDLTESFILLSPALQIAVFFKEFALNKTFSSQIEKIQSRQYETRNAAPPEFRLKVQQLQLQITKKQRALKKKLYTTSVKLIYFTNKITALSKYFAPELITAAFKVCAVSLAECQTLYTAFTTLARQHEQICTLAAPVIDNSEKTASLIQESESFIKDLESCETAEEAKNKLSAAGIELFVPDNTHQFHDLMQTSHYRRVLKEKYEYARHQKSFAKKMTEFSLSKQSVEARRVTTGVVTDTLVERQQDFEHRLEQFLPEIARAHPEITDAKALKSLAKEELEKIDTEAAVLKMAFTQILVAKHQIERPFYYYSIVQSLQKIALSGAKWLGSSLAIAGNASLQHIVKLFSNDLLKAIPVINVISLFSSSPLISFINFKIFNVLIDFFKLAFARKYKPHEYSLEGYQHAFLLEKFKLQKTAYRVYYVTKKALLQTKAYFKNRPDGENPEDLFAEIKANRKSFMRRIKLQSTASDNTLKSLKASDLDIALGGFTRNVLPTIAGTLKKRHVRYYPADTLEFLNRYLHFGDDTDLLAKQATQLLMADSFDFHELLQENEVSTAIGI